MLKGEMDKYRIQTPHRMEPHRPQVLRASKMSGIFPEGGHLGWLTALISDDDVITDVLLSVIYIHTSTYM